MAGTSKSRHGKAVAAILDVLADVTPREPWRGFPEGQWIADAVRLTRGECTFRRELPDDVDVVY